VTASHVGVARAALAVAVLGAGGACGSPARPPALHVAPAPPAEVVHTIFLLGDAGVPTPQDPVLAALTAQVRARPERSTVVFMGDNIYPRGLPPVGDRGRPDAERRLTAQLDAARGAARVVFLGGNHDWAHGADDGWDAIRRQEGFIAEHGGPASVLLPGGGCPGPALADLGDGYRLVAIDTQWWLHGGPKPLDPTSSCPADSPGEVTAALRQAVQHADGRGVVVVGHHPLLTGGPHGGYFSWRDHLFPLTAWKPWLWIPLPILGSAYPLARNLGISRQDLSSGAYREMRDSLAAALGAAPPLLYASGHEHTLQVLDGEAFGVQLLVVSGAGAYQHTSGVARLPETRYARGASGFVQLELLGDARTRLGVVTVEADGTVREDWAYWLEHGR